jgi:hypothetical protein
MRWSVVLTSTLSGALHAQTLFTGRVVDATSGTPLPYCTVARTGSTQGTITNADGLFRITVGALDSVRFSYVGYTTRTLPFGRLAEGMDVRLAPAAIAIGEVVIRPDDRLYERVIRANKWIRQAPSIGSKLFFGMETYSRGLPVEMIHAYYTASLRGGELLDLELKNGRIGVATTDGRLFINYNTTKAFALIAITAEDSPFPTSPLKHQRAKQLRKGFIVEEVSTAAGKDGVDHLRIVPRTNNPEAFTTELWLEPGGDAVRAVELRCKNCPKHPFIPLYEHGRIDTVDLRYKQFWSVGPTPFPQVMQLDYHMAYSGPDTHEGFTTHALMHAYDPGQGFTLPLFTYHGELPDYRKIGWLSEDTAFWQRVQPPLPTARQEQAMRFLRMNDINHGGWFNELDNGRNFFKPPYALWSAEKRVRLIDLKDALALPDPDQRPVPKDSLALLVQFYLDMDTVNGRFIHRSFTVVDGYGTVVPEAREPWTDCFQNIWFDLCEVERRRMEAALNASGMTPARAEAVYTTHTRALQRITLRYLQETDNGKRCEALFPWNAVVKEALGIDNIALLGM